MSLTVPAPVIKDRVIAESLLCGPGPSNLWPSVNEAMTKPIISPMCPEYFQVVDDIRNGLKYAFQTNSKLVFPISGSGHTGMESVISNLLGPEDTLLIASRGIWDERALSMATRYGIKTKVHKIPMNTSFTLAELEADLKRDRPTALFITYGDSSTGTVQNLEGLGDLCHKYGALLIVDTVVSLVAIPFFMDAWGVDAVYTSTQKAFSGPAGITPVAFSDRAEVKINSRKHEPPFYFDAKLLAAQWNCYGNTKAYHHTLSPPLIYALRCCLQEVIKETLPKAWARHEATAKHFEKRIEQMSLKFLVPKPEDRLATVTTVVLPKGYDYLEFALYMRDNFNIVIFAGLGPTVGKALRIGLMGVNSTIPTADKVADAMEKTLKALKKSSL